MNISTEEKQTFALISFKSLKTVTLEIVEEICAQSSVGAGPTLTLVNFS